MALAHCHDVGVAHRDIKPANMVFASEDCAVLMLCDFGFSARAPRGLWGEDCRTRVCCAVWGMCADHF